MSLTPYDFTVEDSSVARVDNKPFICRPEHQTSDTVVLLIHGFTGTPWEMAPVARHLAEKGFLSVAVRLPGHGTTPEDLARRRFEEWVESVHNGQLFLKKEGGHQVAIGLSTGAMVAIAAHLSDHFDSLVLLAPYLKTRHRLVPLAGLIRYIIPYQQKEITIEDQLHYYDRRPVEGVHQLNRLIKSIKGHLPSITVPTLVACSDGDITTDPESAVSLYRQLGSQIKELHRFGPEVPHVLTTPENPRQQEVLALISRFIENLQLQP